MLNFLGDEKIIRPMESDWGALSRGLISLPRLVHQSSSDQLADWLSPPDPSVNLNVACDTHHEGTAVWFTESNAYGRWKEFGSMMWIYGKRRFPHFAFSHLVTDFRCHSGVWQKRSDVCHSNNISLACYAYGSIYR